jgi:hypothetical protein
MGHTWKFVEARRELRYAAGGRRGCGFYDNGRFDGQFNCDVNYARLKKQKQAAATSST